MPAKVLPTEVHAKRVFGDTGAHDHDRGRVAAAAVWGEHAADAPPTHGITVDPAGYSNPSFTDQTGLILFPAAVRHL
jgi:hypothetical protein